MLRPFRTNANTTAILKQDFDEDAPSYRLDRSSSAR